MLTVKRKLNSQTSLSRAIGSLTDPRTVLLRSVGQPTIFGTTLVVRQRIKTEPEQGINVGSKPEFNDVV